jgi:hypothetical protein
MSIRRERDARRVAKSIRTWDATMDAYSNATGWARINTSALDKVLKKDGDDPAANMDAAFPTAKRGDRATGNIFTAKDNNPRAKVEFKAIMADPSEKSRMGHTLGKGHVATTDSDGNAIRKAHTDTHKGHYWKPSKGGFMTKSKCTGCGASSTEHYKDLNNGQVGWK